MEGRVDSDIKGNLLSILMTGDMTLEIQQKHILEVHRLLKNAPQNLRVLYDARPIGVVDMSLAMSYRKFITEDLSPRVVKGVGIAPSPFIGFLGKICFALSPNHKMFYASDIDQAMNWLMA